MENNIVVFDYQGSNIPFALTGNDVMINATEMIKLFPGKRMNNFLRSDQTQELLTQLSNEMGVALKSATGEYNPSLIKIIQGGISKNQGTWMNRKIAIAFAMWLSPVFYSWCLGKIDEIINQGYAFRDVEIQRLTEENTRLQGQLQTQESQINYYNKVLQQNKNSYTTRDLCQELGLRISNKKLLREIVNRGFGYRVGKKFYLKSPWCNMGYRITTTEKCNDGNYRSVTRWTESGKYWIWSLVTDWKLI